MTFLIKTKTYVFSSIKQNLKYPNNYAPIFQLTSSKTKKLISSISKRPRPKFPRPQSLIPFIHNAHNPQSPNPLTSPQSQILKQPNAPIP